MDQFSGVFEEVPSLLWWSQTILKSLWPSFKVVAPKSEYVQEIPLLHGVWEKVSRFIPDFTDILLWFGNEGGFFRQTILVERFDRLSCIKRPKVTSDDFKIPCV